MLDNFRQFEVRDPFGVTWHVEFLWQQTAISIRHSDSVDVKFALAGGEERTTKVVALAHPDLLLLSQKAGRPITDPWVSRLAAEHLKHVIATGEDADKELIAAPLAELERYAAG